MGGMTATSRFPCSIHPILRGVVLVATSLVVASLAKPAMEAGRAVDG